MSSINASGSNQGRIVDISAGGVKLSLDRDLKLGDEVLLDFSLKERKFSKVKSLIVWTDPVGDGPGAYGLRFLDISHGDKEMLISLSYQIK